MAQGEEMQQSSEEEHLEMLLSLGTCWSELVMFIPDLQGYLRVVFMSGPCVEKELMTPTLEILEWILFSKLHF